MTEKKLALLGGKPLGNLKRNEMPEDLFKWPVITQEDKDAAMDVIENNKFSGTDITEKFENEFAEWIGSDYAIAYCNGTMSLSAAMFAIGLGEGDEIICPTKTYWGSVSQAINFGASAVFCNITDMLSMDPDDIERCITPRTKALVVVHYIGYPCDMDKIMAIARKHNLKVIEDVSHAQGGMYKGKRLGTFGDVGAMSLMSGKSFAAGELGILVTSNREVYERAMAFGHYDRNNEKYIKETDDLKDYFHIALGGSKGRANQVCTAIARVQLKYYDERCAEIRKAINYFWDLLEGLPGIKGIRVDESTGSNMAGFYAAAGAFYPEQLHGLTVRRFVEAVNAELGDTWSGHGLNFCLHNHKFFKTFDFYNKGVPSRIAFSERDVRADDDACAPSEEKYCFTIPWFKKYNKEYIERFAACFRTVIENHEQLLENAEQDERKAQGGHWYGFDNQEEE